MTQTITPTDPPRRAWLVVNHGSRSTSEEAIDEVRAALADHGVDLVRDSVFPDEDMPSREALENNDVDTLVTFGGDGTITCAATKLDGWRGRLLVLPGGTMNLVPKALHDDLDLAAIIAAACERPQACPLPFVEAQGHRGFARIIAGPAAVLVHVRETVRAGRFTRLWRAIRFSWKLAFSRTIGIEGRHERYHAIFVHADDQRRLHVDAVAAEGFLTIFRLASAWILGWMDEQRAIASREADDVTLISHRPIHILFDGEEFLHDPPVRLRAAMTQTCFFRTRGS